MPSFQPRQAYTPQPPWHDLPLPDVVAHLQQGKFQWSSLSPPASQPLKWQDSPSGGMVAFSSLMYGRSQVRCVMTSGRFKFRETTYKSEKTGVEGSETSVYYALPATKTSRLAPLFAKLLASAPPLVAAVSGTAAFACGTPLSFNDDDTGHPKDPSLVNWIKFKIPPKGLGWHSDDKENFIPYEELVNRIPDGCGVDRQQDSPVDPTAPQEVAYLAPGLVLNKTDKDGIRVYLYVRLTRADLRDPPVTVEPPQPAPSTSRAPAEPDHGAEMDEDDDDYDLPSNQQALKPQPGKEAVTLTHAVHAPWPEPPLPRGHWVHTPRPDLSPDHYWNHDLGDYDVMRWDRTWVSDF